MARTKPPKRGAKIEKIEPESEIVCELRSACAANDTGRVVELLNNGSITAADATACLRHALPPKIPVIRLLLEHGANPAVCATTRYMQESIELIKLLVEFGCDIKGTGHWVLQCVIR